jgi:hypothetical protein
MSETEAEISNAHAPPDARTSSESRTCERAPGAPRAATWIAFAAAIALALAWTIPLSREKSWGWDESMHAELPAARMLVALEMGRLGDAADALLGCAQYPFVYPCALAAVELVFGMSDHVARVLGTLVWCAALFGLFLLGREIAERLRREQRDRQRGRDDASQRANAERAWRIVPWLTMALGALSPLALAYSGTLFLEVPFTCVAVFTLRAWLRRDSELVSRADDRRDHAVRARRRDLAAGAWITTAFFVKYNYGLMLAAGLGADWLASAVSAARRSALRAHLERTRWLCLPALVACAWWFVLPVPGGFAVAHEHRAALVEFLAGNTGLVTPFAYKPLHAFGYFALNPRMMLLELAALAASARFIAIPSVRCLWCAFLFLWVPVWLHPFHVDRFFVPGGAALWPLAAIGVAGWLPSSAIARVAAFTSAALIVLLPIDDMSWLAGRIGVAAADPALRAYQSRMFASWRDLSGSRPLPTAGLTRSESDAFLDAIAREAKPDERVAWFGLSSELSPAALHLGLLARGGSRERFLRDSVQPLDVAYFYDDPHWSDERLVAFASAFDVILFADPIDFKARRGREFMIAYCTRLTDSLGYRKTRLAEIQVSAANVPPRSVKLYACRRS